MTGVKVKKFGEWAKLEKILSSLPERFDGAVRHALNAEAQALRGHIVKNITSGGQHAGRAFDPLSPLTLAIRRFRGFSGSKPLNVTRGLAAQVSVVNYPGGAFIGIRRGAPHKSGVANLAWIHEFGATSVIPKTRKMVRFLAAAFRAAGLPFGNSGQAGQPGVIVVRIRPRPFVEPVISKYAQTDDVVDRFWTRISQRLAGDIGK